MKSVGMELGWGQVNNMSLLITNLFFTKLKKPHTPLENEVLFYKELVGQEDCWVYYCHKKKAYVNELTYPFRSGIWYGVGGYDTKIFISSCLNNKIYMGQ